MRKALPLLLISAVTLSSCGMVRNSWINPGNWFGRSESRAAQPEGAATNPLIPERSAVGLAGLREARNAYKGQPVDQLLDMTIDRTPTGAIVRVTAQAATQGSYHVRFVPQTEDGKPVDGVLRLTLMAVPLDRAPVGTDASRRIHAAYFISEADLAAIRTIEVIAARNALTSRR